MYLFRGFKNKFCRDLEILKVSRIINLICRIKHLAKVVSYYPILHLCYASGLEVRETLHFKDKIQSTKDHNSYLRLQCVM